MLSELIFSSCNDAAKLLYFEPDDIDGIEGLDLRLISELKRGNNGTVEVKLANRSELLKILTELIEEDSSSAENFFKAVNNAASVIGDGENED